MKMSRLGSWAASASACAVALLAPIGAAHAGIYTSTGETFEASAQYQAGQRLDWVTVAHQSELTNQGGGFGYAGAYNESRFVQHAGDIDTFGGYQQSVFDMLGGNVDSLQLNGNAQAQLRGGSISSLLRTDEARITIYGSSFQFENNLLSGTWADGTAFSFWLFDGTQGNTFAANLDYVSFVQLAPVPEPTTYALTGLGLAALGVAARRRRRNGDAG
ncbi:PEP-CTERM sorting domain-containing protein [Caldimonas brevitalea]|uniref:Ice-binding protein C-terminal domain-containing protein n=1 Tax=Caldimonas brevitalea TaxID=413882 RepID=A0A0G3BP41_9BURK|nr:PEP-CTERM sorting domain-containing protein [Caldimonas brevitalea]AKJ29758.1 hypothetical protein AAW51_3067 [Caldimonas brevitalea]